MKNCGHEDTKVKRGKGAEGQRFKGTKKWIATEGTESTERKKLKRLTTNSHELARKGVSVSLVYSAKTARKASFVAVFCHRPQGQFLTFF